MIFTSIRICIPIKNKLLFRCPVFNMTHAADTMRFREFIRNIIWMCMFVYVCVRAYIWLSTIKEQTTVVGRKTDWKTSK